jgi:hypothetical protein
VTTKSTTTETFFATSLFPAGALMLKCLPCRILFRCPAGVGSPSLMRLQSHSLLAGSSRDLSCLKGTLQLNLGAGWLQLGRTLR